MKQSKYNFFLPYEEDKHKKIAYNSKYNNLALLTNEDFQEFQYYCKENLNDLPNRLFNELVKGGFIVEDNRDELKEIEAEMYQSRFDNNNFGLTIAPTSNCNFRCIYCYEKNNLSNCSMSLETEQKIINMIEKKVNTINSLKITWYGGEPLLNIDVIERLTNRIVPLCNDNNVQYSSHIITNGYLLTRENILILNKCHIESAQISIDGDKESHDSRRPLKSGHGTYDTIINNLAKGKDDIEFSIALRINIDKKNLENMTSILDTLCKNGLEKKVLPYPALVHSSNGCYDKNSCLNLSQYGKIELQFFQEALEKGFNIPPYLFFPSAVRGGCGASSVSSFVINANGDIYKCWEHMGIEDRRLGNIHEGIEYKPYVINYLTDNPTKNEKCNQCKFLPICMGGACPHLTQEYSTNLCVKSKRYIEEYLNKTANLLMSHMENE